MVQVETEQDGVGRGFAQILASCFLDNVTREAAAPFRYLLSEPTRLTYSIQPSSVFCHESLLPSS